MVLERSIQKPEQPTIIIQLRGVVHYYVTLIIIEVIKIIMSKIVLKNKESLRRSMLSMLSNQQYYNGISDFHYQMRIIYTWTICHPPSHVAPATLSTKPEQALKYIYILVAFILSKTKRCHYQYCETKNLWWDPRWIQYL